MSGHLNRRAFLQSIPAVGALSQLQAQPESSWNDAAKIVARIQPPTFPKRDFDIKRYGAVGDGRTNATQALARSIAECSAQGGGRGIVPKGIYLTAPIHLKSDVHLHLAACFSAVCPDKLAGRRAHVPNRNVHPHGGAASGR